MGHQNTTAMNRENKKVMSKKKKRGKGAKKLLLRKQDQVEKLQARNSNLIRPIDHSQTSLSECDTSYSSSDYSEDDSSSSYSQEYEIKILPPEELGIDDGSMYDRLLDILDGDEICPEDYDLLLQLDNNNVKSTLKEDNIEKMIPVMIIGEKGGEE